MKTLVALAIVGAITWWSLWFTPDQQGQRLMNRGEFQAAAETFRDPMRQGVAWFARASLRRPSSRLRGWVQPTRSSIAATV